MTAYRVLAADLFGTIREEIPFQSFKYSKVLNAPGAFNAALNLWHPKCTRSNLDPGRTAIYVERDGTIVWGGILWTAQASDSGKSVDFGAEGWWSYFKRRLIRTTQTFAAADQLAIAQALMTYALAQPGSLTGITVGAETSGVLRDRVYYSYDRMPVAQSVEQLAAVIAGFDFSIETAWSAGAITKAFQLYYPKRGSRTNLVFDLGTSVTDASWQIDATTQANVVDVLGSGNGDAMLISTAADASSLAAYPLLEETVANKSVLVQATLDAQAGAEVISTSRPIETIPTLVARATTELTIGSFIEGDEVTVRASGGFFNVNGFYRILSYEVSVDENGRESISVSFGPTAPLSQQ